MLKSVKMLTYDHTCNLVDQLTLDGQSSETIVLKNQLAVTRD